MTTTRMTTTTNDRFYCNQKFWWLTVDLEKSQTFSCCAASPQKANVSWIKENPGHLFNNPELQTERRLMLDNQPVSSCQASCWKAESHGLPSRRTVMMGDQKTHTSVDSYPEILHIIVGTDCNMTCVYCCKFYSTAWTRDILKKSYPIKVLDDRFTINNTDKILAQLSQKDLAASVQRQVLLDEIARQYKSPTLKEVMITGGEPFLYLDLEQLVLGIPDNISVKIWSGLGVNESRFAKEVSKLPKNVTVVISAENIEKNYEFARHGNTWQRFLNNIETLKNAGISYEFNATVTNLTIFGLLDFVKFAGNVPVTFSPCTDPDFLAINVLDSESKQLIRSNLHLLPEFVAQTLEVDPTEEQVYNVKSYINEYSQRRQLDLSIFPACFVDWITK